LSRRTKTQHAPDDFGHKKRFVKTENVGGPPFFPHRALYRELKTRTCMNTLKFIFLAIVQFAKQIWLLPRSIAMAARQKRQWIARNKLEAERLDRIRNPEKYLGK
jgi:hypothetical protein